MTTRVVATAFGGPEVLSLESYEAPVPGPGQVRVRVRAAAVNPWDHKQYSGLMGRDESRLPMPLGLEAAGDVVAVGPDADGSVAVGDAVVVYPADGAYAEEVVVPVASVSPKPDAPTWAEAAGLFATGTAAAHLVVATSVGAGDTVLVHGASGSVGRSAVQLAVHGGARVIGTASERNHDALTALGAEPVTYGDGLAERVRALAPDGVDAALDTIGTDEAVDVSLELVGSRERFASVAAFHRAGDGIRLLGSGPGAEPGTEIRDAARRELLDLAAMGAYRVFVGATYPLAEAAEAHRVSIAGHPGGKLVLEP